jgi:3',5'-cyclic AMP phosphodiesterase CpdA
MNRRAFLHFLSASTAGLLVPRLRAQAPLLCQRPYLQSVGADEATIVWSTTEPGAADVELDAQVDPVLTVAAVTREFRPAETGISAFHQHTARIRGLRGGASFEYRVRHDGKVLARGNRVALAPSSPTPFTFHAFGDSGQATAAQRRIADLMAAGQPDLVLHTGDLAYSSGTFEEFQRTFFAYYGDLIGSAPFFPTPGNHDYVTRDAAPYRSMFTVPSEGVPEADRGRYYSFDWGNAHFVSLDSNAPLTAAVDEGGSMLDWFDRDLAATRRFWRIVFFHHPPYAAGTSEGDSQVSLVRDYVVPILERHGVQLVLNGHHHSYQRTCRVRAGTRVPAGTGTVYVTTGGGGGELYRVDAAPLLDAGKSAHHYCRGRVDGFRLTLHATDSDGAEVDELTLAPQPVIDQVRIAGSGIAGIGYFPRAVVRISGRHLAAGEQQAVGPFAPLELDGTVVHCNGVRMPLCAVAPGEIRGQLRVSARGPATVRVTTPNGWVETVAQL